MAVALAGGLALGGLATPALAVPPGNNGTVKIDGEEFDAANPNNEPHVGCIFQVDFYGYDAGGLQATVNFTGQAPTGKDISLLDDTVQLEDDPAGGGNDLDAAVEYDLSSVIDQLGDPHPKQGFHITLTIHVPDGSHGADVKHKTFWVEGCKPKPTPTPTTTKTPSPSPTHTKTPKPTPTETESTESPAPVPTAVPAGTDSPGAGSGAGIVGLAVVTVGAAAGTAVMARRRRFLHES
jgi:cell division septation protein DedD